MFVDKSVDVQGTSTKGKKKRHKMMEPNKRIETLLKKEIEKAYERDLVQVDNLLHKRWDVVQEIHTWRKERERSF